MGKPTLICIILCLHIFCYLQYVSNGVKFCSQYPVEDERWLETKVCLHLTGNLHIVLISTSLISKLYTSQSHKLIQFMHFTTSLVVLHFTLKFTCCLQSHNNACKHFLLIIISISLRWICSKVAEVLQRGGHSHMKQRMLMEIRAPVQCHVLCTNSRHSYLYAASIC